MCRIVVSVLWSRRDKIQLVCLIRDARQKRPGMGDAGGRQSVRFGERIPKTIVDTHAGEEYIYYFLTRGGAVR